MSNESLTPYDVQFRRAVVRTDRNGLYTFDIRSAIVEMSIYESIDKLSLSGYIIFIDDANIFAGVDFQGQEKIEIEVSLPNSPFKPFSRTFCITGIEEATKANDQSEMIRLSFVDEDALVDILSNVQKAYDGTLDEIISKILKDNFESGKELVTGDLPRQKAIRAIIPNWRPYTAIQWLADRATSDLGMPFFAYSTLLDRNIRFFSLQELLENPPASPTPYRYNQALANATDLSLAQQETTINTFSQKETESILPIINSGGISGKYEFIDTNNMTLNGINYDITKTWDNIRNRSNILQDQETPNYDREYEVHRGKLHEYGSSRVAQISASAVYSDVPSYHEDQTAADHSTKAISYSIKQFIRKSELTVSVPGRSFFPNEKGMVKIGSMVDLEFIDNFPKQDSRTIADHTPDVKRSGRYLVHSTRHLFSNQNQKVRYSTVSNMVKLGNLRGNTE